jgi:hypothetical protein
MTVLQTFTIDVPEGMRLVISFAPEPRPSTSPAPARQAEPEPIAPADKAVSVPPRVVVPSYAGKYAPQACLVDGARVILPACVTDVLRSIAAGVTRLKFRPETMRKLRESLPWLACQLERDRAAKVLANRHTYTVPASLLPLIDEGEVRHG